MEKFGMIKRDAVNSQEIIPTKENEALVLFERLNNPIIKNRLIEDMYLHETTKKEGGNLKELKKGVAMSRGLKEVLEMIKYRKPNQNKAAVISKDLIEKKLNKNIGTVFNRTDITFHKAEQPAISPGLGSPGIVAPYAINPATNEKYDVQVLSMAEAHEKGHGVRRFHGESDFTNKLSKGFDFSNIPKEDLIEYKKFSASGGNHEQTNESMISYFNNTNELIERMSQLKNYFGMKGNELFTKQHLDYARQHYLDDYQFPAQMRIFLSAITTDTEPTFIELMNTLGV